MCVIAYLPGTKTLDKEIVSSMWDRNDDGGGLAFFNPKDELEIHRTMDFAEYWALFTNYRAAYPKAPMLLHMRIGTQGTKDISNVHPFPIHDGLGALAHNGQISGTTTWDNREPRSDTRIFVEDVLPHFNPLWLDDKAMVEFVEDAIGGSKLAVFTKLPGLKHNVYILNSHKGEWVNGIWFSNLYGLKNTNFVREYGPSWTKGKSGAWTKFSSKKETKTVLPKPKDEGTQTGTSKTESDSFQEWMDGVANTTEAEVIQDKQYVNFGTVIKPTGNVVMSNDEERQSFLEDCQAIHEERTKIGYANTLVADLNLGYISCSKCEFILWPGHHNCDCFNAYCINKHCGDYLAFCECESPDIQQLTGSEIPPAEEQYRRQEGTEGMESLAWLMD